MIRMNFCRSCRQPKNRPIQLLVTLEFSSLAVEAKESALQLKAGANELKISLDKVQSAERVISAVASALKVVERFLVLVA